MRPLLFKNARILDPEASRPLGESLLVEEGRIAARLVEGGAADREARGEVRGEARGEARGEVRREAKGEAQRESRDLEAQVIDLTGRALAPGFIDLHFHGELIFASPPTLAQALDRTARCLIESGTTAFLATTVAWQEDRVREFVTQFAIEMTRVKSEGASILGIHLEGPWINPAAAGAQPPAGIRPYERSSDLDLLDLCGKWLKMVTLAPEIPGCDALLRDLDARNVVAAIGHSHADDAIIDASIENGLTHVTHLFNAMNPMHHRAPGVAGFALGDDRLSCDLICDGVHVHPAMVRAAARAKGEELILITDKIEIPPHGEAASFGSGVVVNDGNALRLAGGGLAGSTLDLDRAIRNAQEFGAMTRLEAIAASTLRPARLLGIESERGTLRVGARADFAILDDDDRVVETWIAGRRVHPKS